MEKKISILSVGTNMHKARLYLKAKGYNEAERQKILDALRRDIPNARLRNCKFLLGVTRMFLDGDFNVADNIFGINNALKYIADDAHFNEYDFNLNGDTASTICDRFKSISAEVLDIDKVESKKRTKDIKINSDYDIIPVDNFETASKFAKETSWCVTQSESAYSSYTSGGAGRFYFCLKKGYTKTRKVHVGNSPLDEYGLSMIAVSVTMDGDCNTVTCRWNHDNGGNDSIMTVEELEKLLGRPFYETFKPYTSKELKEKGLYVSENIGKYFLDMEKGIEGIIAAVNKDETPKILMDLSDIKSMTWDEAMAYNRTLKNGWHIPPKETFEEVWAIKGWDNPITKKINNGVERYNKMILNKLEVSGNFIVWHSPEGSKVFPIDKPIVI